MISGGDIPFVGEFLKYNQNNPQFPTIEIWPYHSCVVCCSFMLVVNAPTGHLAIATGRLGKPWLCAPSLNYQFSYFKLNFHNVKYIYLSWNCKPSIREQSQTK